MRKAIVGILQIDKKYDHMVVADPECKTLSLRRQNRESVSHFEMRFCKALPGDSSILTSEIGGFQVCQIGTDEAGESHIHRLAAELGADGGLHASPRGHRCW